VAERGHQAADDAGTGAVGRDGERFDGRQEEQLAEQQRRRQRKQILRRQIARLVPWPTRFCQEKNWSTISNDPPDINKAPSKRVSMKQKTVKIKFYIAKTH